MSRETERAALSAHFQSVWLPADGPIAWPNRPFTTPADSMFCVFNLVDRGTTRQNLGFNFFKRHHGTMQVDIYTPQGKGTKRSREISQRLEDIYEMLVVPLSDGEAVVFGTPSARTLDPNVVRAANLDDNWDRWVFEGLYYREQHVEK